MLSDSSGKKKWGNGDHRKRDDNNIESDPENATRSNSGSKKYIVRRMFLGNIDDNWSHCTDNETNSNFLHPSDTWRL
jgi:hypothetical protein